MSNYTKTTDFEAKDSLPTGDAEKIIRGADFETEFDSIATAIATKADTAGPTFTGTATFETTNATTVQIGGVAITSTAAELNVLDGITSTTAELNTLDGFTGTFEDLNYARDLRASGVTSDEFDILDGLTATADELNLLDGSVAATVVPNKAVVYNSTGHIAATTLNTTGSITVGGGATVDGRYVSIDGAKLDGIEAGATADQTAAEIRTLVEAATDSNVFTDADHSKLDGIEALADVTDTANVTAAGALMDSELTSEASVKALNQGVATTDSPTFAAVTVNGNVEFDGLSGTGAVTVTDILDQDDMSGNSATALATQQSIKAYVDTTVAATNELVEDTTPQLGGDLDLNGNDITGTGNINNTGTITTDGLTVESGAANIGIVTKSTDQFAFIGFEDNTSSASSVYVGADGNDFIARANSLTRFRAASNGDVSLYEDTGTTAKFFWDASAESLGIGTSSPSGLLHIASTGASNIKLEDTDNGFAATELNVENGGRDFKITTPQDTIFVQGSTEAMRILDGGNVGIGTDSPSGKLSISGATATNELVHATFTNTSGAKTFAIGAGQSGVTNNGFVIRNVTDNTFPLVISDAGVTSFGAGNVGIGTSSPSTALHLSGLTGSPPKLTLEEGGAESRIYATKNSPTNSDLRFQTEISGTIADRMVINYSGNVGIGTSSPTAGLECINTEGAIVARSTQSSNTNVSLRFAGGAYSGNKATAILLDGVSGENNLYLGGGTSFGEPATDIRFHTGSAGAVGTGSERMRIDSSGLVGIGASSPSTYDSRANNLVVGDSGDAGITIFSGASNVARLQFAPSGDTGLNNGLIGYDNANDKMSFATAGSDRMHIDSGGNAIFTKANGAYLQLKDSSAVRGAINVETSDGLVFTTGASFSERMRISSGGDVQIGTAAVTGGRYFDIYNTGSTATDFAIARLITQQVGSSSTTSADVYKRKNGEFGFANNDTDSAAYINFKIGASNRMRIDSSGNLLVGTTTTNIATEGTVIYGNGNEGVMQLSSTAMTALYVNRSNEGELVQFRTANAAVGSIGVDNTDNLTISGNSSHAGLNFSTAAVLPYKNGNYADDAIDLGEVTSARWQDIYATNGTIQTSDRNEKQDIEELSEAEQRVAVVCKGLLRKFRWKSAVEKKGDDARIHFGIIAQDLQDAFTAEGLDAGRYGMFINSTWTDEETGEERSRMGVRYSELLAFIISAI